ncbi:MAG: lamin tail domain-containing protein, partial [Flavobacteriales bacterium]
GWGYRLEGDDNNSSSNWVASSVSVQNPGDVNNNVSAPFPPHNGAVVWKDLSTNSTIDTSNLETFVGPYSTNGTFTYELTYNTPCGIVVDTAYIFVQLETVDTLLPITACDSFVSPYTGVVRYLSGFYTDTVLGKITNYDSLIVSYNLRLTTISNSNISQDIDTIRNLVDSINLKANSAFSNTNKFFFTEINQRGNSSTGAPVGGRPSWLTNNGYVEITGPPNIDLEGYSLEYWHESNLRFSYTFPSGTVLSPNGIALIATAFASNSPANYYYSSSFAFEDEDEPTGRVLKDSNGVIIDAVGYYNYTFPLISGVTSDMWSGVNTVNYGWGYRLEGEDDNTSANWVNTNSSNQDPGEVNTNVTVPNEAHSGAFAWKDLTTNLIIDTTEFSVNVGSYSTNGNYLYEFTYNTPCGLIKDTASVYVQIETYDTLLPFAECDSFISPYNGKIRVSNGFYTDTVLGTITNYDSLMVSYQLTVKQSSVSTISADVCDSFVSPLGRVLTLTNTYFDTLVNAVGCDSIITINLIVRNKTSETISPNVCDSYTSPSGKVWTMS